MCQFKYPNSTHMYVLFLFKIYKCTKGEEKRQNKTENRVRFLIWALGKCWGKWRKFPALVYCSPPLSLAGWTGITSLENPLTLPSLCMPMALPPCSVAEKSKHQAWGPSLCVAPQPMGKLNILNASFSWSPFYFLVVPTKTIIQWTFSLGFLGRWYSFFYRSPSSLWYIPGRAEDQKVPGKSTWDKWVKEKVNAVEGLLFRTKFA